MRRTLELVLFAGFVGLMFGCFPMRARQPETPATLGPLTGDKEHTLEYWGKVREVMQLKSNSSELRQVAAVVQRQTDAVRSLHIDAVDKDLYVAALAVSQYQDKLLKATEAAGYNPAALRSDPDLKKTYTDSCQQIAAAITRLKGLQPTLSARYGVQFPLIEDKQ